MNLLSELRGLAGAEPMAEGVRLTEPYAEAHHAAVALSGQYRLRAQGIGVEIEMVETATKRRSLVYVRDGEEIILFIRPGRYDFYLRFLSAPGAYAAQVELIRMGVVARAGFLLTKAVSMLRRPPGEWLAVAGRLLRPAPQGIVGARVGEAVASPTSHVSHHDDKAAELPGAADLHAGVSIIIPTKVQLHLLSACVSSLDMAPVTRELIVVDNGATDPAMIAYLAQLSFRPDVRILRHDAPFNFSELCNLGARRARYPTLLFLNDDIEAMDGQWLGAMLDFAARPDVGVVGARLIYPSGDLQHAGVAVNLVPGPGHPWRGLARETWSNCPRIGTASEVDAVTGACLMIAKSLFDSLGGFDEEAFAVTLNDVDLCLKVRARGLKIIYVPQATLIHKEGRTRKRDDSQGEVARREAELAAFYERYGDLTRHSVFYPPSLRRDTDTGAGI